MFSVVSNVNLCPERTLPKFLLGWICVVTLQCRIVFSLNTSASRPIDFSPRNGLPPVIPSGYVNRGKWSLSIKRSCKRTTVDQCQQTRVVFPWCVTMLWLKSDWMIHVNFIKELVWGHWGFVCVFKAQCSIQFECIEVIDVCLNPIWSLFSLWH